MKHWLAGLLLERSYVVGPSAWRDGWLYAHLERCTRCRAEQERFATFEQALGRGLEPSAFALERIEDALLRRVTPKPSRAPVFLGVSALATAALVVMLLPASVDRVAIDPAARGNELVARGRHVDPRSQHGVRVFRFGAGGTAEAGALSLDDALAFTYTNLDPEVRYLTLVGIQDDSVRWYFPSYDEDAGLAISAPVVDEPVHESIRLRVNHTVGRLTVVALFSRTPLAKSDINDRASLPNVAAMYELELEIVDAR